MAALQPHGPAASRGMAEHEYRDGVERTMERNGQHPGLSRMTGPSSAQLNMDLPEAGADNKNERVGIQKAAV